MDKIIAICVLTNVSIPGLSGYIEFIQESKKEVEIIVNTRKTKKTTTKDSLRK